MLEAIIRVLAPHYCIGCGQEDTILCDACRMAELRLVASRCYVCKKLTRDHAVCSNCKHHGPLRNVWVGAEYSDAAKTLVHRMKFERARAATVPAARQLTEAVPIMEAVVVPVPTATSRRRQRGYDQSVLIARQFARQRGLPYQELLIRNGQARQVGTSRSERVRQAESFFTHKKVTELPEAVLLIDDVLTTGATLQAAARCLRQAGVRRIYAAVFAQKQ